MKYIFFTYNITGMGGGQQYIFNKVRYLQNKGYDVHVFSAIGGDIVIQPLLCFEGEIITSIKYPPYSFYKRTVKRIMNKIMMMIGENNNDSYIESDGGYETMWAEMIAQKMNCQHIIFNLNEIQNKPYSESFLKYLFFKYKREELFGITKDSLKLLFGDAISSDESSRFSFSAPCNNVVDELGLECTYELQDADYNIGGIWRTNKDGFVESFEAAIPFFHDNNESRFNIVIIGAGSPENEARLKKVMSTCNNVSVIFLGFLYPIPVSLLGRMDVFISTSGSSRVSMKYGIPTISVTSSVDNNSNVRRVYALGILNYTTRNTVVPEETDFTVSDLLSMVLMEHFCSMHSTLGMENEVYDDDKEFDNEMLKYGKSENIFYDIGLVKPTLSIEKGYTIVGHVFGEKIIPVFDHYGHVVKKLLNKWG